MPDTVRKALTGMRPKEFLTKHNPAIAAMLLRRGTTCGEWALREDIPTLAHVAEVYGRDLATAWLKILLSDVENVLGTTAYPETAVEETARNIYANYADWNVANVLQFFGRYKSGEWAERMQHLPGLMRIMAALKVYAKTREEDMRRVLREREEAEGYRQREEWAKRAVSHEEAVGSAEYIKGFEDAKKK